MSISGVISRSSMRILLVTILCIAWSTQAYSFYTVHRVSNINIEITFQVGLGSTSSERIKKQDFLEELSNGKPGKNDMIAAVVDCNNPDAIFLVVWNKDDEVIVPGSDMIGLFVYDSVVKKKGKQDLRTALIDADALFGSGYITASMKFSEIKSKLVPAEAAPEDETFCMSKFTGLSAAGYVDGDTFGVVSGGRINIGKPMATMTDFVVVE